MIELGREYYHIHREIWDWLKENTQIKWGDDYDIVFGVQYIDLSPEESKKFKTWLKTKGIKKSK